MGSPQPRLGGTVASMGTTLAGRGVGGPGESRPSTEGLFAPVRSQSTFEETLERLGTAIKLGLLEAGERLPAERELCARMEISRSTLRQALTALVQSGHLHAVRGRGGGTFVAEHPPWRPVPSAALLADWRGACDARLSVEVGVAMLAAERAPAQALTVLDSLVEAMRGQVTDFEAYRQTDVRLHVGLAQAAGSPRLVTAMTEAQGEMTDLIAYIAHPPEVLAWANGQHARMLAAVRGGDPLLAAKEMAEHLRGTEHVLSGLL